MSASSGQPGQRIAQSVEWLARRTAGHNNSWGLRQATWRMDLDAGTITFYAPTGVVAIAPIQIIGTRDSSIGNWRWGWAHSAVRPGLAMDAMIARQFGAEHGLDRYTTPEVAASEAEAWEFTAVAFDLAKAQGAYLGHFGPMGVFMTFGMLKFRAPH